MSETDYQKMKEAFSRYLKGKRQSRKTITSRLNVLQSYQQWLDRENLEPEQVSYTDLLSFMKYRSKQGASQRTIQNYMSTIHHLYEYLKKEGKVSQNPTADIEIKGVKRKILYQILEPYELQAIYNNYNEDTPHGSRNKAMLGLLVNQGLKTEELARLEVKDVNLREGKVDIKGSRKSNGREMQLEASQVMDMYDYVLKARNELQQLPPKHKHQQQVESNKLFIGDGGNHSHFSNYVTQLMLKVKKINPSVQNAKQIRASVITKWLRMYNLREVQYKAGHRYISSTESYQQNDMEGLREEVQQYHPLG